jgi:ABC-2 type transport system permease protein
MMKTIRTYAATYAKFLETSTSVAMSFRTSFVLLIIMDLCFYLSTFSTVNFIYEHVAMIGPWQRDQLLFFISFMLIIDNLHMTFVSENFWELSFSIRTGAFDFVVLRPLSTIFSTFFRHFRPSTLLNLPVAIFFLIKYGLAVELAPLAWALIPVMVLLSFTLLLLIEFTLCTSMFWLVDGFGINFLRMQMQQLARWPDFVYGALSRRVLITAIPILLIGSGPVTFLFDQSAWQLLALMLMAIVLFFFILKFFWRLGLRRYDSASS